MRTFLSSRFRPLCFLVMLLRAAPVAGAVPGVNFFVNDCGGGVPTTSASNLCSTNTGTAFKVIGSMLMSAGTLQQFSGCESRLDIQTDATGGIEDWWRADACRPTGFVAAGDVNGIGGSCPTVWDNVTPSGTTLNAFVEPGAPDGRIRFLVSTVIDAATAATTNLVSDGATEVSVFSLTVLRVNSIGPGACAGCGHAACLVLNEIAVRSLLDVPATALRLTDPLTSRHVSYNGSLTTLVCPSSVPVRMRTWGMVKALYR